MLREDLGGRYPNSKRMSYGENVVLALIGEHLGKMKTWMKRMKGEPYLWERKENYWSRKRYERYIDITMDNVRDDSDRVAAATNGGPGY